MTLANHHVGCHRQALVADPHAIVKHKILADELGRYLQTLVLFLLQLFEVIVDAAFEPQHIFQAFVLHEMRADFFASNPARAINHQFFVRFCVDLIHFQQLFNRRNTFFVSIDFQSFRAFEQA